MRENEAKFRDYAETASDWPAGKSLVSRTALPELVIGQAGPWSDGKEAIAPKNSPRHSAPSCLFEGMTNSPEGQISPATGNASVPRKSESNAAKSWFVPPIVVPAFLMLLIVARAVYTAFS